MAPIFDRVKKIIIEQLGVDEGEVLPSANFVDDLGADSLDLVELIMSLEEEFSNSSRKVEIPDEDAQKMATIQAVIVYLNGLGIKDN